jgi:predicted ABC-type ATPase
MAQTFAPKKIISTIRKRKYITPAQQEELERLIAETDNFNHYTESQKNALIYINRKSQRINRYHSSKPTKRKPRTMKQGGKINESTAMVLSQNKEIAHHTQELKNALKKNPEVEPWVIGKIERASTDISDVTHYLDGRTEYAEGGEMESKYMVVETDKTGRKRVMGRYNDYGSAEVYAMMKNDFVLKGRSVSIEDNEGKLVKQFEKGGAIEMKPLLGKDGERRIDAKAIDRLEMLARELPQTKYANIDKNGRYIPLRKQLHKKIVDTFTKNKPCIVNRQPIAILTGGAPASGKSTFIKKYVDLDPNKVYHVDADEVRAMLPEYEGWNASQTHLETSDIVTKLIDTIGQPCEFDLIYDGTMNRADKYTDLVDKLHNLGYKVFIIYISIPKEVSIERSRERYKSMGRYVPKEVIDKVYSSGLTAFEDVAKNMADGYVRIDGISGEIVEKGGMEMPKNVEYGKGGKIGFEALSNKVAKNYEGKSVKPEYRKLYGKTYSKEEAKEVGDKVASKVYRLQLAKMEMGGEVGDNALVLSANKMGYIVEVGDDIYTLRFPDGTQSVFRPSELQIMNDDEYFADGGAIKGSNPSTGEKFGVVVGSLQKEDGLTTLTIRSSYSTRINSYELRFDEKGFLSAIGDFGYSMDGTYPDMNQGSLSVRNVNADNKKETIDAIANITSPSFAKKVYDYVQAEKMAKGGVVGDFFYDSRKDKAFQVIFEDGDKMGIQYLGMDKKPVGGVTTITKNEFEYNVEKGSWGKWKQAFAKGGDVDDDYRDFEMVVLTKDANGKSHNYRFLISARNINEAKEIATDLWNKNFGDMDETFYKVMSNERYRMDYGMADGGSVDGNKFEVVSIMMAKYGQQGAEQLYEYLEKDQGLDIVLQEVKDYRKEKGVANEYSSNNGKYDFVVFKKADLINEKRFEQMMDGFFVPMGMRYTYSEQTKMGNGGKVKGGKYNIIDEGKVVETNVSESGVIDYANTIAFYDLMDESETGDVKEIDNFQDALNYLGMVDIEVVEVASEGAELAKKNLYTIENFGTLKEDVEFVLEMNDIQFNTKGESIVAVTTPDRIKLVVSDIEDMDDANAKNIVVRTANKVLHGEYVEPTKRPSMSAMSEKTAERMLKKLGVVGDAPMNESQKAKKDAQNGLILFTPEIDKKLFEQYKYGSDMSKQDVVAKIFNPFGAGTWYVMNADPEEPDYLWGIVDLFEVEMGSMSREELVSLRIPPLNVRLERDVSFKPINAKELWTNLQDGKKYKFGGNVDYKQGDFDATIK